MLMHLTPFRVKAGDGILNGRSQGRSIREEIVRLLEESPADHVLPLDFGGVLFMDFSCADEMLVKLIKRLNGDLAGRYIILQNLSGTTKENVEAALQLRQLACVYQTGEGNIEVLGKVHPVLLQTYEAARSRGRITVRDLVDKFRLETNAGSNRLAKLHQLGLLAKVQSEIMERGGRIFVYEPVH